MPTKERMAVGFAVYAYGCAFGAMLAGAFAPSLASLLVDSFQFNFGDYAITFMVIVGGSLLGGFLWGGLGGVMMGALTDPQYVFPERPKFARMYGGLCVALPILLLSYAIVPPAAAIIIAAVYFAVTWITTSISALSFIERNP